MFSSDAGWGAYEAAARQTEQNSSPERQTSKSTCPWLSQPKPALPDASRAVLRGQVGGFCARLLLTASSAAQALCCQTCALQNILASILSRSTCFWSGGRSTGLGALWPATVSHHRSLPSPVVHGVILLLCGSSLCSNTTFITL